MAQRIERKFPKPQYTNEELIKLFDWYDYSKQLAEDEREEEPFVPSPQDLCTEIDMYWEEEGQPLARKTGLFSELELTSNRNLWIQAWKDNYAIVRLMQHTYEKFKTHKFYAFYCKHYGIKLPPRKIYEV